MTTGRSKYQNFGNVGAMGDNPHSDKNTFVQFGPSGISLAELAQELARLRAEMKRTANPNDPTQDAAIGAVAQAEAAARSGDTSKMVQFLKGAGTWALDVSKSIAAKLATDLIQRALNS